MKNVFVKAFIKLKKMFSFEEGIDITDDYAVLKRKNIVIKNIIFLSNIAYMVILFVVSLLAGGASNWVLTLILLPITYIINGTLKKLINDSSNDKVKQQIAMYVAAFYMFLSAILIYFKLKSVSPTYTGASGIDIGEAGYILLYYSLLVVSLYQDKKMLLSICKWTIAIVTVLHFTLTYNIASAPYANDLLKFVTTFFTTKEFADIALRTLILILFMIVLISNVQISQYVYDERKKETMKRQGVQTDFSDVVSDLFTVILGMRSINANDDDHIKIVDAMSLKLAEQCKLPLDKMSEIKEYVSIHVTERNKLQIMKSDNMTEADFMEVRRRSEVGAKVAKRLQLEQKCEDIIRMHIEGMPSKSFKAQMNSIQMNMESQVVLLTDSYVTMREAKSYKRPYSHKMTVEFMKKELTDYFDEGMFEKFVNNNLVFEEIYNNLL